jgi:MATE family multidrug resistance protein
MNPDASGRSEFRNVVAMAVPGVLTNSARALMDFTDYVLVKYLHSDEAQAAILSAQMVFWTYTVLGTGIVMMVNTFAAQALGRRQPRECGAYLWQALYVSVLLGVAAFAFKPFLPALFARIGHDPGVQGLERVYAHIALWMVAPTIISYALSAFFMGIHRPRVAMWSVMESGVVNVVVSIVLMFGFWGFEPMGLAGAAWGTVIALTYRTLRLLVALFMPSVRREYATAQTWRPSWPRIRELLRVGVPCGLTYFSEIMVWAVFVTVLVGRMFGTAELIATSSAWQYLRVSFLPAVGFGQALTALVGRSIGSGRPDRARRETYLTVLVTLGYMGALSILYALAGSKLIGWFNPDPVIAAVGGRVMICAAVFQLFDAFGITYVCALRGAGDTILPAVFFVVSQWTMIVGGGWWVATTFPELGSVGPWMAASALIIVTAVFLWWRWKAGAWTRLDLFERRESAAAPPSA